MALKFEDLQLHPQLQESIKALGYSEMTPIQEQSIPPAIAGRDLAGLAQTGTGKTAAFLIPLLERYLWSQPQESANELSARGFKDWTARNFFLILTPTRELAEQVQENVQKLGSSFGVKSFAIYGGTGYDRQKEALKSGLQFIVATPGRLIDLYKENLIDMKQVRGIVFDEADRMFDMGFKDDMKYILERVPRDRQFLVFSATLNFDVLNTAYQFGADPVEINISRDQAKAENVKDEIFHVGQNEKPQHLLSLLKLVQPKQAIIFTNFKNNVERITRFLVENKIPAVAISSLVSQAQRNHVIQLFKAENETNILVATDVAARGLDIKGVDLVVNFELPMDAESYVHRIGRTGRAGSLGRAYSFVSDRDVDSLMRIQEYLKNKVTVGFLEDKDLIKEFSAFPREEHYSQRRHESSSNGGGRSGPSRSQGRPAQRGPRTGESANGGRQHEGRPPRRDSPHQRNETRNEPRNDSRNEDRSEPRSHKTAGPHSRPVSRDKHSGSQSTGHKTANGSGGSAGQSSPAHHHTQPRHKSGPNKDPQSKNSKSSQSREVQGKGRGQIKSPASRKPNTVIGKIGKLFKTLFGS